MWDAVSGKCVRLNFECVRVLEWALVSCSEVRKFHRGDHRSAVPLAIVQ